MGTSRELDEMFAACQEAIDDARKVGTDTSEARLVLDRAKDMVKVGELEDAIEVLEPVPLMVKKAKRERVGTLLESVRDLLVEDEGRGGHFGESRSMLTKADEAFEMFDLTATVDHMNVALQAMLGPSLLIENSKQKFLYAKELNEESRAYLEDVDPAGEWLDRSRDLYGQRKFHESLEISEELIDRTESLLVDHIERILVDKKAEIVKAKETGSSVAKARAKFKLAMRYCKAGKRQEALQLAMRISRDLEAGSQA